LPVNRCTQQEACSLAVERDLGPVGRQFHVTSKWPSCGFDHQKIGAAGRSDQRAAIAVVDFEQSQHFHAVREIFQVDPGARSGGLRKDAGDPC
jgi:hypothetical protein